MLGLGLSMLNSDMRVDRYTTRVSDRAEGSVDPSIAVHPSAEDGTPSRCWLTELAQKGP